MTATKNKPTTPINTCPCCGEVRRLAIIAASDGREWINAACSPCGMAMDETDKWTFYAGDVTRSHPRRKEARMKHAHASIYFHGTHRPLHAEGETLESCVLDLMRRTRCQGMRWKIMQAFGDFTLQRNAGIRTVSVSHEGQGFGVRLALHRRDPWLDKMTVKFPPHPEIDYAA